MLIGSKQCQHSSCTPVAVEALLDIRQEMLARLATQVHDHPGDVSGQYNEEWTGVPNPGVGACPVPLDDCGGTILTSQSCPCAVPRIGTRSHKCRYVRGRLENGPLRLSQVGQRHSEDAARPLRAVDVDRAPVCLDQSLRDG